MDEAWEGQARARAGDGVCMIRWRCVRAIGHWHMSYERVVYVLLARSFIILEYGLDSGGGEG